MTEYLLSCHNSQESSGVCTPLSITKHAQVDVELVWLLQQLGGKLDDLDPTLKALEQIAGRLYINISWYARNMSAVLPTDPISIGVPPQITMAMSKPPTGRLLMLPSRFYRAYQNMIKFHKERFPAILKEQRDLYQALRRNPSNPLPLIWPIFDPEFVDRADDIERARVLSAIMVMTLDNVLRKNTPDLMALFTGNDTSTSLISHQIWELRQIAEKCGEQVLTALRRGEADIEFYKKLPEAAPLLQALQVFLDNYGHRGFIYELDYESERLADRTDLVILAIAGQLKEVESPDKRTHAVRLPALESLGKMAYPSRKIWGGFLGWGQRMIAMREDFKSTLSLNHAMVGLASRMLARHFYPQEEDDLFMFYTWQEFLAFGRSRGKECLSLETIYQRREELKLNRIQPPPPEMIWYDPQTRHWRQVPEVPQPEVSSESMTRLQGIPAGAGKSMVEGVAIVTNDPIKAAQWLLERSDENIILVTRLTDPAWSSLFLQLTAVVTEMGGVVSHAAIVARENGLPAVVGVSEATKHIRNGQHLRIDGMTGLIEIMN